jgi:hypothetical protein
VTGAPDGTWPDAVAVTVSVTVSVPDAVAVTVSVTVSVGCGFDAADAAPEATPGVPAGDVLPDEADVAPVPVGEVVTVGEMIVGLVDEDEVQAETATGASSVRAPQHSAVSLAPNGVPAVVPRTFMEPPPAPADDVLVPAPGGRNRIRKGNV